MRPLEEQTIVVTGATDGLGRHVAAELAARGAHVVVHGRDPARCETAVREIRASSGNERVGSYLADFSRLADVRRLAGELERDLDRVDVLVNNAAVGPGDPAEPRSTTEDGLELRFGVNYLAPFLLTELLLPLLLRSAPARIVNVASLGQQHVDLDDPQFERGYTGLDAYRRSKLAQIAFTVELAERLGEGGVTVNALHPAALMNTKMALEAFGRAETTIEQGAEALLHLIADPVLDGVSGRYFDGLREGRALAQAYDPEARRRLWELSERLVA